MLKAAVFRGLARAGRRRPHAALALAVALAKLTRPLGRGVELGWIEAAFPELDERARRAARHRIWEDRLKEAAAGRAMQQAGRSFTLPSAAVGRMRGPLILACFHVGPVAGLDGVLKVLPGDVVALERGWIREPRNYTLIGGNRDRWERARSFNRALTALRRDGFVFLAVDAHDPGDYEVASIDVPMLGRTLPVARGAFALARIAGVPIVPIAARWSGTAIEVVLGEQVEPSHDEAAMATATAAWIERYLRARPGETSLFMLGRLQPPLARRPRRR